MATLGGVKEVPANENSLEVIELARFAVEEHNKKEVRFSLSFSGALILDSVFLSLILWMHY